MNTFKHKIHSFEWLSAFVRGSGVASLVGILSLASVAEAESIPMLRNVTSGQTIFHDDFENQAVIPLPAVSPNTQANALPSTALTGNWASVDGSFGDTSTYSLGVVDSSTSVGGVAANEGDQFLQMSTTAATQGIPMRAIGVAANSGTGDTIEVNIAFNISSGSRGLFYLFGGGNSALIAAFTLNGTGGWGDGTDYRLVNNVAETLTTTTLGYTAGSWNTLNVVYENNTTTMDVSINGGQSISLATYGATGSTLDTLFFHQSSPTTIYYDAVAIPEPSSILLMGLGVVMTMVAIRRRQRG